MNRLARKARNEGIRKFKKKNPIFTQDMLAKKFNLCQTQISKILKEA